MKKQIAVNVLYVLLVGLVVGVTLEASGALAGLDSLVARLLLRSEKKDVGAVPDAE